MSIATSVKNNIFKYVSSGISNYSDPEEVRKIYLLNIFTFVAVLFVLPLGINAFIHSLYPLAFALLGIAIILSINYLYLKLTYNQAISAYIISLLFYLLMTYLVYTGGVSNTGPLWIYPLPLILMFLLGFRKGLLYSILFIILNSCILLFPNESAMTAIYTDCFKLRIILSLLLVTLLAAGYEYIREKSYVEMQKLRKILESASRQDPLTGLYNRRVYEDNIVNISNTKGIILMCDIDHFKTINDVHGHSTGDKVLIEVAKCIRKNIRQGDLATRWGGEEFLIFLDNSSMDKGYSVSEKIRKSIETLPIHNCDDALIKVTISIGMSVVDHTILFEEAIKNADNAMYMAKKSGRNKTEIYHITVTEEN